MEGKPAGPHSAERNPVLLQEPVPQQEIRLKEERM